MPLLVGTKYDLFKESTNEYKMDITTNARKYAKKMGNAPLIYCSSKDMINIKKIFKLIVAKLFDLHPKIKPNNNELKETLIEFICIY